MRPLFLILALSCISVSAQAAEIKVLEIKKKSGHYIVTADLLVDAPIEGVYEVLTDYDRFHELSSMVSESRFVESDESDDVLVFTRATGCVLFFCKTVDKTEVMETIHNQEVITTVIPEQSTVNHSVAKWTMAEEDGKIRLQYELNTELGFWVPPVIGTMVVKRAWYKGSQRALERLERFARDRVQVVDAS